VSPRSAQTELAGDWWVELVGLCRKPPKSMFLSPPGSIWWGCALSVQNQGSEASWVDLVGLSWKCSKSMLSGPPGSIWWACGGSVQNQGSEVFWVILGRFGGWVLEVLRMISKSREKRTPCYRIHR